MKIPPISFINNRVNNLNNEGRNNRADGCFALLRTPKQDTISFKAQVPYIPISMEKLIEKTASEDLAKHSILTLANWDVPCICCGKLLYSVDKYKLFVQRVAGANSTKDLLDAIRPDKKYLHPTEQKIFKMFVEENRKNPDKTLLEILKDKLPHEEPKLISSQSDVFFQIQVLNKKSPRRHIKPIKNLILSAYSSIFSTKQSSNFSRKIFIKKLSNILKDSDDVIYKLNMISAASALPTSYNDSSAFIVKYAKRNYKNSDPNKSIVLRMLGNSLVTEEHTIPRSKGGGPNIPENVSLECACDNNRRGNDDIMTQVFENPEMIKNFPIYFERLCQLNKEIGLSKSYILGNYKIYNEGSFGLLKIPQHLIDYLKDKAKNPPKQQVQIQTGITPTKEERRLARKEKLKEKNKQQAKTQKETKHRDKRIIVKK